MTDVTQLLPGGGRVQPQRQVVAGYVSTNKSAPVDFSSALYVILPQLDPSYNFGPCKWGAAQGSTLPAQGTEVLVCFDDENVPVVVWWEGSPGFAPTGAAGGSLTGNFPNPTLAAGSVGTSQIVDANVTLSKLATGAVQNFLQLASAASLKLAHGSQSITFTAAASSAVATVTHGLGTTPSQVLLTANGTGGPTLIVMQAFTIGATTFQMQGQFISGTGTATVPVGWAAIG